MGEERESGERKMEERKAMEKENQEKWGKIVKEERRRKGTMKQKGGMGL